MKKLLSVLAMISILIVSGALPAAEARDRDHRESGLNGAAASDLSPELQGRVLRKPPEGYRRLTSGKTIYFHQDGIFFRSTPSGYQRVKPPIGAVFPTLYSGVSKSKIGNVTYYESNGTFFIRQPGGYVVVPVPRQRRFR